MDALAVENIAQKNAQRNNTPSAIKYNRSRGFLLVECYIEIHNG